MELTPELVIKAYSFGLFPMAESRDGEIHWCEPEERGIIKFDNLHISKNLAKLIRSGKFTVTYNRAFPSVIRRCANRDVTWISNKIEDVYTQLHMMGFAHSVEVWEGNTLAGGLYGVALGGAFCGESMFHTIRDASKVALVYLIAHMCRQGFTLLDTQYINPHTESMGATTISQEEYRRLLVVASMLPVSFCSTAECSGAIILQ